MFALVKPSHDTIRRFLDEQRQQKLTYRKPSGASEVPPGFVLDHHRIDLGRGTKTFDAAVSGLQRWRQFQLGWLEAWPADTAIREGEVVAVIARAFGLWSINACRIVRTIDGPGPVRQFGFAYGTLPDHVESGEEQFLIEWDATTDIVSYDILAFSRPRHVLAKLAYPLVRRLQKRFAVDSMRAMILCVDRVFPGEPC